MRFWQFWDARRPSRRRWSTRTAFKRPPTPPAPPAVSSAPGGDDDTKAYSADETRDLLSRAAGIEIGPDGVRLTDKDGGTRSTRRTDGIWTTARRGATRPSGGP